MRDREPPFRWHYVLLPLGMPAFITTILVLRGRGFGVLASLAAGLGVMAAMIAVHSWYDDRESAEEQRLEALWWQMRPHLIRSPEEQAEYDAKCLRWEARQDALGRAWEERADALISRLQAVREGGAQR